MKFEDFMDWIFKLCMIPLGILGVIIVWGLLYFLLAGVYQLMQGDVAPIKMEHTKTEQEIKDKGLHAHTIYTPFGYPFGYFWGIHHPISCASAIYCDH